MSIVTAVFGIIVSSFGINQAVFSMISIPLMILYCAYCLKRIYNLNFTNIFLRSLLFFVVLGIVFVVVVVIMIIIMFLNGDIQQMIEAQKAAAGL